MRLTFTVEVEVERETGKFASRDELAGMISEALESANPDQLDCENGGIYAITDWSGSEVPS